MTKFRFEAADPIIESTVFIASGAIIVGDVQIGAESSLWYNSVLRGDVFPVRIGKRTNLQDLVIGHVTSGTHALVVGDEVTVGHRVILHGCTVHDRCLIGMGAVVMDGAEVGPEAIVGAGSVVVPNTKIPPRTLAVGSPARIKRDLSSDEINHFTESAQHYVTLAKRHRQNLQLLK